MRYFILAGEPSGDLYASGLIQELKQSDAEAVFEGFGGDKMEALGVKIHFPVSKLSMMGFWEVVRNISIIKNAFKTAREKIKTFHPDVVILVDYPGFNLKMAKWAKKNGYKVVFYIAPQVWAWKPGRIEKIKKYIDRLLVILPFEERYFREKGVDARYVGHPMVEHVKPEDTTEKNLIALFPGSRKQEVVKMLPVMIKMAAELPNEKFGIAGVTHLIEWYPRYIQKHSNVEVYNDTAKLWNSSKLAIVKSGTSSLEAAFYGIPQVVVYKAGYLNYRIARFFVRLSYISLVNILLGKSVVIELIQRDFNIKNLIDASDLTLLEEKNTEIMEQYGILRKRFGNQKASETAAKIIMEFLEE